MRILSLSRLQSEQNSTSHSEYKKQAYKRRSLRKKYLFVKIQLPGRLCGTTHDKVEVKVTYHNTGVYMM